MKKYLLRKKCFILGIILLFIGSSIVFTSAQIPTSRNSSHQTFLENPCEDARWATEVNGKVFRGWIQYTLEKGIAGRRILVTGTWGTDDGNFSGDFTLKNFIFLKFYGTYQGVFLAEVSGDDYTIRFIGVLRNDWEVGYWKTVFPATMQIQIVHIPFN
jgi:hypothetical protein